MVAKTQSKEASSSSKVNSKANNSKPTVINRVDPQLLQKALSALLKHHTNTTSNSNTTNLLGDDSPVHIQYTLQKIPQQTSSRPIRIDIPHPLHKLHDATDTDTDADTDDLEDIEACLFVKDESKPFLKEQLASHPQLTPITKIITLTSLRKNYTQYKDRRTLLQSYGIFFADARILPMLGKLLGKSFFAAKKQPIPINIKRNQALPFAIDQCLKSTYMYVSPGTCLSVRIGSTNMSPSKLMENCHAVLCNATAKLPKKWSNVSAIHVKCRNGVALPVYNRIGEEMEEIASMAGVEENTKQEVDRKRLRDVEDEEEEGVKKEEEQEKVKTKKQKKDLEVKSPLAKALKKQKKMEQSSKSKSSKKQKKKESTGSPLVEKEETMEQSSKSSSSSSSKKQKKKESTGSPLMEKEEAMEQSSKSSSSSKKQKKKESTGSPLMEKEEAMEQSSKSSSSSSSKKQKKKTKEPKETVDPDAQPNQKKEYIASKKFKGSKKGHVFRMGDKGLGYYIDVKPVVNKMALQALARANRGGGGSSGGASSGRRRSASQGRNKGGRKGRR